MPITYIGSYPEVPAKVGMLAGLTGAIGRKLAEFTGAPTTRLRLPLAINDTTAYVETTLGYRDAGAFYCFGEYITYTSRDACTFYDLGREEHVAQVGAVLVDGVLVGGTPTVIPDRIVYYPAGLPAHPVNTPVVSADRRWSVSDQARDDVVVGRAEGRALRALANDRGFPRVLGSMTDDDLHNYLIAQWYAKRQPWMTAFDVFRWVFRAYEKTGADARVESDGTYDWLVCPSLANAHLLDRWIYIVDTLEGVPSERLCRIKTAKTVDGETWILPDPLEGPYFRGPDIHTGHTGVSYRLVAFTFDYPWAGYDVTSGGAATRRVGAELRLRVYAAPVGAPFVYLMTSPALITDPSWPAGTHRPKVGCLLTSVSTTITGCPHGFFLPAPFKRAIRAVGTDLVAAGVKLSSDVLPA